MTPSSQPVSGRRPSLLGMASLLEQREVSGRLLEVVAGPERPRTEAEAYYVQAMTHDLRSTRLRSPLAGYKIAATTHVMQQYLDMGSPCSAVMLDSLVRPSPTVFDIPGHGPLGVECEIAVRLGSDLPPRSAPYSQAEVAEAVEACFAAIEVVEDRYVNWRATDAMTLIADNFFHHGAVLGPPNSTCDPHRLDEAFATMTIDGAVVGEGRGSDVLGHPLLALAWLADQSGAFGQGLRAGQVVLLGSLVQTNWVAEGSSVSIANDLLGSAEVSFTRRPEMARA